jgi:acyl-CoA thioesterase-1
MPIGRILTLGVAAVCAIVGPTVATPLNIVAIGASNTAGWGVGVDHAYPAVLQTMLRERGYDAYVSNAGISFSTTNAMLRRLDLVVKPGTAIVILQPGGNDTRFFGTKEQRARNIASIVDRLRARHIRVIVFENAEVVPAGQYQWDGIHFTKQGHLTAATYLLEQVIGAPKPETKSETKPETKPETKSETRPAAAPPQSPRAQPSTNVPQPPRTGGGAGYFPTRSIQSAKACMNLPTNSRVLALVRLPCSSNRLAAPPI